MVLKSTVTLAQKSKKIALYFFKGFFSILINKNKKIKFDESFDPSTLNEPKIKLPIILRPDERLPPEFLPAEGDTVVEGFRVQVISTQDIEEANRLFTQLSPTFEGAVYIIFESPNYTVRIGNFLSRSTAEQARKRIAAAARS